MHSMYGLTSFLSNLAEEFSKEKYPLVLSLRKFPVAGSFVDEIHVPDPRRTYVLCIISGVGRPAGLLF